MKFYYEDKLIRTSKTHVYTHALIDQNGKAITCSATREGCEKELSRRIRELEQRMMNHENALKAQAAGSGETKRAQSAMLRAFLYMYIMGMSVN